MNCFGSRRQPRRAALQNALDEIGYDAYEPNSDSDQDADDEEPLLQYHSDDEEEDFEEPQRDYGDSAWLIVAPDGVIYDRMFYLNSLLHVECIQISTFLQMKTSRSKLCSFLTIF